MTKADARQIGRLMASECLSVRVRRLGRVITRIYDGAISSHGVGIAQLNLLAAIAASGGARAVDLARILELEKSTLSRDLQRMEEAGWIRIGPPGPGGRALTLTSPGSRLLLSVRESWEKAQSAAEKELGKSAYAQLRKALPPPLKAP